MRNCALLSVLTAALWLGLFVTSFAQDSELVAELEQSVVRVLNPVFDKQGNVSGLTTGTGVIINDDGYIATNHHVIDGHKTLLIAAYGEEALIDVVKVIWKSRDKDLAILKVDKIFGKPASFSTHIPEKADRVLALGYPGVADRLVSKEQSLMGVMALDATLTTGVIGRKFEAPWGARGEDLSIIQHSAQINKGNSGGPLFDECGRVIGINTQTSLSSTQGVAATGVFFASDANELLTIMDRRDIAYRLFERECKAGGLLANNNVVYMFALAAFLSLLVAFYALRRPVLAGVKEASRRVRPTEREQIEKVRPAPFPARQAAGHITFSGMDESGHIVRIEIRQSDIRNAADGFVIGRHHDLCHAVISSNLVSKRQCRVFERGGTVMIEDLNATNPTEVNGRGLESYNPQSLNTGDQVLIGETHFSVTIS